MEYAQITRWRKRKETNWKDVCHDSKVPKSYCVQCESLTLDNGRLKRSWESADGKMQLIVPKSKVQSLLKKMHDGAAGGHLGINITTDKS